MNAPDRRAEKRRQIERKYGLNNGEYLNMLEQSGGMCWICLNPESVPGRSLAIDHDHVTGSVRGLLCTRCNQVLGRMSDDPTLFDRAAEYLRAARARYSDACRECRDIPPDERIMPPAEVVESVNGWTRFAYVCRSGHVWTCGYSTGGYKS